LEKIITGRCSVAERIMGVFALIFLMNCGLSSPIQLTMPNSNEKWKSIISYDGASLCGLDFNDSLYCWGRNSFSPLMQRNPNEGPDALGTGSTDENVSAPRKVMHASPWNQVEMGDGIICGLDSQEQLYCWGANHNIASGGPLFRADIPGQNNIIINRPHLIENSRWSTFSVDDSSMCGLKKEDGSLWCWGALGHDPLPKKKWNGSFIYVLINHRQYITLDASRRVYESDTAIDPLSFKILRASVYQVATYMCGIAMNDKIYCRGNNDGGYLGVNSPDAHVNDFTEIVGGGTFVDVVTSNRKTCAIKTDKTLWCWGENVLRFRPHPDETFGLLGTGSKDRFVKQPEQVLELKNVEHVTISENGSLCAIDSFKRLYCWGDNTAKTQRGRVVTDMLGVKNSKDTLIEKPILVDTTELWKSINVFSGIYGQRRVNCGINDKDALFCWGFSEFSLLGVGERMGSVVNAPTLVKPRVVQ
jgi:alpha-tubulin suppressor-like RCC1 family protein